MALLVFFKIFLTHFVFFGPFSTVFNDRHFSCEDCDGCVSGGFDSATSQVDVLFQRTSLVYFFQVFYLVMLVPELVMKTR